MSIVTLDDVKDYLNISDSKSDTELLGFLDGAVATVEDFVGPLSPQSFTEEIDSHGAQIVLSRTPVISVQSVSIEPWLGAGAVDDTAAWRLNKTTGVMRRTVVGGSLPYYGQGSVFTVTYTAGRTDVPLPVNRAILMQVRLAWRTQRGSTARNTSPDAAQTYQGAVGLLDPAVVESLTPYLLPPGVA